MSAAAVRAVLEHLGWVVDGIAPVAGGDLNDAYRVDGPEGPRFVKSAPRAAPGTFAAEAAGLRWLGEPGGGVAVPEVLGWHDPPGEESATRLLALEWIDPGPLQPSAAAGLGAALARTHLAGAPAFGATPWLGAAGELVTRAAEPSHLGPVELPNAPAEDFATFLGAQRLLPLARMAVDRGTFDAADAARIERLVARLPELCGPAEPPARCHGDLWTGNVLAGADGRPRLIDPAAHGGHREQDLAVLRLFGAPPAALFDAYAEVAPLAEGHEARVPLLQLPTVLLHVVLFGGGYTGHARAIISRYL